MAKSKSTIDWYRSFVIFNLLVLDIFLLKTYVNGDPSQKVLPASTSACPSACVSLINSGKSLSSEEVISISSSGTTQSTSWTTIAGSGISFNKTKYKGAKKFYFQANLSSDASDLTAFARLFDATHGIGITGSEMTTKNTSLRQIQSGELNPFSGDLDVRVQIKSLNGNLVTLSNPRIVVVY